MGPAAVAPSLVLPVGDHNPTRRTAVVTSVLIAANVAVFVLFNLQLGNDPCALQRFFYSWAAIPRELLTLDDLPAQLVSPPGLRSCVAPVLDDTAPIVTAVTSMFLHGSLFHLLFNMLFLWVFGNNVEDRLGHVRYAVYYLVGGIVAAYAFAVMNAEGVIPLLGASGAVAAVLGGYFIMYPRAKVNTYVPFPLYLLAALVPGARVRGWFLIFAFVALPAWLVLGFWFLTEWLAIEEAAQSGVANEAHIAGFVAGVLMTFLLRANRPREPQRRDPAVPWH